MTLNSAQLKLLASFFTDIAKGLFLGLFASQALLQTSIVFRFIILLSNLGATLLFVWFALRLAQGIKDHDE